MVVGWLGLAWFQAVEAKQKRFALKQGCLIKLVGATADVVIDVFDEFHNNGRRLSLASEMIIVCKTIIILINRERLYKKNALLKAGH
jgi:hypothetical protein